MKHLAAVLAVVAALATFQAVRATQHAAVYESNADEWKERARRKDRELGECLRAAMANGLRR